MKQIKSLLQKLEKQNNITILYAVESGSRIYGFESEESDYDIRFIYKRPTNEYLKILNRKKDLITYMSQDRKYDVVGWDIDKALKLHYKSNPTIREWILSPIKYHENKTLFNNLPQFNLENLYQHYYSLAKFNYKKYSTTNLENFIHKKYSYVFRGLLSCKYILEQEKEPPININELKKYSPEFEDKINILTNYEKINTIQLEEYNNLLNDLFIKYERKSVKNKKDIENLNDAKELYNQKFLDIIYDYDII